MLMLFRSHLGYVTILVTLLLNLKVCLPSAAGLNKCAHVHGGKRKDGPKLAISLRTPSLSSYSHGKRNGTLANTKVLSRLKPNAERESGWICCCTEISKFTCELL